MCFMIACIRVQKWEGLCSLLRVSSKHGSENLREPQQTNGRSTDYMFTYMACRYVRFIIQSSFEISS